MRYDEDEDEDEISAPRQVVLMPTLVFLCADYTEAIWMIEHRLKPYLLRDGARPIGREDELRWRLHDGRDLLVLNASVQTDQLRYQLIRLHRAEVAPLHRFKLGWDGRVDSLLHWLAGQRRITLLRIDKMAWMVNR